VTPYYISITFQKETRGKAKKKANMSLPLSTISTVSSISFASPVPPSLVSLYLPRELDVPLLVSLLNKDKVQHLLVPHTLPIFTSIKYQVLVVLKSDLKLISTLLFLAKSTLWACYIRNKEEEEYFYSCLNNWLTMKLAERGIVKYIHGFLDHAKEKKKTGQNDKHFPLEEFLDTYKDNAGIEFTGDALCQHVNGETTKKWKCEQMYLYCSHVRLYTELVDKIKPYRCTEPIQTESMFLHSNDRMASFMIFTKEVGPVIMNITRSKTSPPLNVHQLVFSAGSLRLNHYTRHNQFASIDAAIVLIKSKKAKVVEDFLSIHISQRDYQNRQEYLTRLIKEDKWNVTNVFWHEKTQKYREFVEVKRIRKELLHVQQKADEFAGIEIEEEEEEEERKSKEEQELKIDESENNNNCDCGCGDDSDDDYSDSDTDSDNDI
jgi:hypothetical protein